MFDLDYEIGTTYSRVGDFENAIPYLKRSIKRNNNKESWNDLGVVYERMNQYKEAYKCYVKGAELGSVTSLNNLGYLYECGLGVKKDYNLAIKYYKKAIVKGDPVACNHLAIFYFTGTDVAQDDKKGIELLKRGASIEKENGYQTFHNTNDLAYRYSQGLGVRYSPKKAAELWTELMHCGDLNSYYNLAVASMSGKGVEKDIPHGISNLVALAINKEYGYAFEMLARLYDEGKVIPESKADCGRWLVEGARHGDPECLLYILNLCLSKDSSELEEYRFKKGYLEHSITDFLSIVYGEEKEYSREIAKYRKIKEKYPNAIDWEYYESIPSNSNSQENNLS